MTGKKTTAKRVLGEVDDILTAFTGRNLGDLISEGWAKLKETGVGNATDPLERAARAMDPYIVLGLPKTATVDQVQARRKQLAEIYHPDREGGNLDAMKLVNNAADEIVRKMKAGG